MKMSAPIRDEEIIKKHYPNSFRETGLYDYLNSIGISTIIVTGMMTHHCIESTVRAAYDLGYKCIVAGDCCTTKQLTLNGKDIPVEYVQNAFLAGLHGRFSTVMSKDEVIELLQ